MAFEWALQIIDRCLSLLTIRRDRRRRFFSKIIVSTFDSLRIIAADYLKMYETVIEALKALQYADDPAVELERLIASARLSAAELKPLRVQIQVLNEALGKSVQDERVLGFGHAVDLFFFGPAPTPVHLPSRASGLIGTLEAHLDEARSNLSSWYAAGITASLLESARDELETRWLMLCQEYASLKLRDAQS